MLKKSWPKQVTNDPNVVAATKILLSCLDFKVDNRYLDEMLPFHPAYPSIKAISDTLSDLYISNFAAQLDADILVEIDFPFIAQRKDDYLLVVLAVKEETITLIDPSLGKLMVRKADFVENWSGIVFMLEKNVNSRETSPDFYEETLSLRQIRKVILPVLALLFLGLSVGTLVHALPQVNLRGLAVLMLHVLGLAISTVLVLKEENAINQSWVNKICKLGGKYDCSVTLQAPLSKFFKGISLAEIGGLFFSAGLCTLLLAFLSSNMEFVFQVWGILTALAFPFTLFSLYYQAKVIKNWCSLCVGVQIIVWLELGILYPFIYQSLLITWSDAWIIGSGISFPIFSFLMLKPLVLAEIERKRLKNKLLVFRKSSEMQEQLQKVGKAIPITIEEDEIIFETEGSSPTTTIVLVISPLCKHCGRAFEELIRLYETFPHQLKVILRFFNKSYKKQGISSWEEDLINFYLQNPQGSHSKLRLLINSWYESKKADYPAWKEKNHINGSIPSTQRATQVLDRYHAWGMAKRIAYTPYIIINDRAIPEGFSYKDMRDFIQV